jgi:hypothetical protein
VAALSKNTELVIEGFPRSANTFAFTAFLLSQKRHVEIGHHLHAPAHIIVAVRRNLPTIVIIRDPEETVLSHIIRRPYITIKQALRAYRRFYACLLPYSHNFITALFETVIEDFGLVIRNVNQKFGTDFKEFINTESNVKKCFRAIQERHLSSFGVTQVLDEVVAYPSEERKKVKDELRSNFYAKSLAQQRKRAFRIYEKYRREMAV